MRENHRLAHKISRTLLALFTTCLFVLLAWGCSPVDTITLQIPTTPTPLPGPDFVTNIPQKALWKNYVTVSAEAAPGTACLLIYVSPSGTIRETDAVADKAGLCEWRWKIEEAEGKGHGRLIFIIGEVTETHFLEILPEF